MKTNEILIIGSSNTDMSVRIKRLPRPGETVLGGSFTMDAGGKGANQAVAACRLGGKVSFICKVGNDMFGKQSLEAYKNEGIDISYARYSDKPSGVALIYVDDKAENCIAVASGANMDFSDDIGTMKEAISKAGIILLQLEIPVKTILAIAQYAAATGTKTILNPAPVQDLPDEIYRTLYLIVPNEKEAEGLTGIKISDEQSATEAALKLLEKGVKNVIITLGAHGALLANNTEVKMVKARKVQAKDTTAAGDTFCGAIAVAIAEGCTLTEAVGFANKASSLTVQRTGAQASIPTRAEVDNC